MHGTIDVYLKPGAPFKLSERDKRFIPKKIKKNRRFPVVKHSSGLEERSEIKFAPKLSGVSSGHAGEKVD